MQQPSVGRIVHYYDEDGAGPIAAIITKVTDGDKVSLTSFGTYGTGPREHSAVPQRALPGKNCWDWPPRL
jgi:hypothetical protein